MKEELSLSHLLTRTFINVSYGNGNNRNVGVNIETLVQHAQLRFWCCELQSTQLRLVIGKPGKTYELGSNKVKSIPNMLSDK